MPFKAVAFVVFFLAGVCADAQQLPGVQPLPAGTDWARQMVDGIHRDLDRRLAVAPAGRAEFWQQDFSSATAYAASIRRNRERLRYLAGLAPARVAFDEPEIVQTLTEPGAIAESAAGRAWEIRWPVYPGVWGEGLLFEPAVPPVAQIIVIPDAGETPEQLAGLAPGLPEDRQWIRHLLAAGCRVIAVPLIDLKTNESGSERLNRRTNQTHREYLYRMAYPAGRHVIGMDVDRVLAIAGWMRRSLARLPVGIAGYGEGGLVALYAAALEEELRGVLVSGYFGSGDRVWEQPIYRNVWRGYREFGDAGLAALVAPRLLMVEFRDGPVVRTPAEAEGRFGAAPGALQAKAGEARRAMGEIDPLFRKLGVRCLGVEAGSGAAIALAGQLSGSALKQGAPIEWTNLRPTDPEARGRRMVRQLTAWVQNEASSAEIERDSAFWKPLREAKTLDAWKPAADRWRREWAETVVGELPPPASDGPVRARQAYDEAGWRGWEVVLPVWPDVPAYGLLLVPRHLPPGEKRPLVVTQHGLEGRPVDLVAPDNERAALTYASYSRKLVERGYIVWVPQNPYIFGNDFRQLTRKAQPLGLSMFAYITGQHRRSLDWLETLPFVDKDRIGFYGLSYGGRTAMMVPPLEPRYKVVICSGNFNEWIGKLVRDDYPFTYLFTREYEIFDFDIARRFNHAELAVLQAPRPFYVERGHADGVGIDEWIAYEFAKVFRQYNLWGIGSRAKIEYFDGVHQIYGKGTFEFLDEHLGRPGTR